MKTAAKARFDAKLPKEQKEFFEYAARLGGFRTLTEFVLHSVKEKAQSIVDNYNQILAMKQDQEIFFEAILTPPAPNEKLKRAASRYSDTPKP